MGDGDIPGGPNALSTSIAEMAKDVPRPLMHYYLLRTLAHSRSEWTHLSVNKPCVRTHTHWEQVAMPSITPSIPVFLPISIHTLSFLAARTKDNGECMKIISCEMTFDPIKSS